IWGPTDICRDRSHGRRPVTRLGPRWKRSSGVFHRWTGIAAATLAALSLGVAVPAAGAKVVKRKPKPVRTVTATLKAQVAATPYTSGGTVVIPLLVSKVTPS